MEVKLLHKHDKFRLSKKEYKGFPRFVDLDFRMEAR